VCNAEDYNVVGLVSGNVWSLEANIPCDEVSYRYFIASIDPTHSNAVHVRKWETHMQTRIIRRSDEPQAPNADYDTFGVINETDKADKGWLTNETILQFKFFNNPFALKERIKNRLLYVKVNCNHQPIASHN